jgi:hypothetical protein
LTILGTEVANLYNNVASDVDKATPG